MAQETINLFNEGIVSDKHPLTASPKSLTDALNATLITYNSNEMILQNDMGNAQLDVPETGKQVRLTKYGKDVSNLTNPKIVYDLDVNKYNVTENVTVFKPIGMVEHGGILYIASEGVGKDGKMEFEIGSFPGPKIEEPSKQGMECYYVNSKETSVNLEDAWKSKNIYILTEKNELFEEKQVEFRPGTPMRINIITLDGLNEITSVDSITGELYRRLYKINILNIQDGNRNITKYLEKQTSVISEDLEDITTYYPNIKNSKLAFTVELENIDSFLIHPIKGSTEFEEDDDYEGKCIPFLIEPYYPDDLKRFYAGSTGYDQDKYYLVFNRFDVEEPSLVKIDQYTIEYSLTTRDGKYIEVDENGNRLERTEEVVKTITSSLDTTETTEGNEKYYLTNPSPTLINLGKGDRYITIHFKIYPENTSLELTKDNEYYPFSEHIIEMNIDLWLNAGLWDSTQYFVLTSDFIDGIQLNKKANGDYEDTTDEKYEIPVDRQYLKTETARYLNVFLNPQPKRREFENKHINENGYSGKYQLYSLGKYTTFNVEYDKIEYVGTVKNALTPNVNYNNNNVLVPALKDSSNDNKAVYKTSFKMSLDFGKFYNLQYFSRKLIVDGSYKLDYIGGIHYGAVNHPYFMLQTAWKCFPMGMTSPIYTVGALVRLSYGYLIGRLGIGLWFKIGDLVNIEDNQKLSSKFPAELFNCESSHPTQTIYEREIIGESEKDKLNIEMHEYPGSIEKIKCNFKTDECLPFSIGTCSGSYLTAFRYDDNHPSDNIKYLTKEEVEQFLNLNYQPLLFPNIAYIGDSQNREGTGIEHWRLNVKENNIKLLAEEDDRYIFPVLFNVLLKDDVEFIVSNNGKQHIENTTPSLNINFSSISQYSWKPTKKDELASFPQNTPGYSKYIITNNVTNWNIAKFNSTNSNNTSILQFYFRTFNDTSNLKIRVKDINGNSIIKDDICYVQGKKVNVVNKEADLMSIKGNTYYKYVLIPIVEYDFGEIIIDIITNNAEFRNFGILRKVNSDSSYEVKGAVLTYLENYTIYQNNDESDIIKLNGIYLPTFPNYYEIYEGTFQLNTNSLPSNNGVFTLPQKDGIIENYNVTVNDKSYTILQ